MYVCIHSTQPILNLVGDFEINTEGMCIFETLCLSIRNMYCFVSWTPHLFSWWSNVCVHYKGHVAATQMADWADCDLCTKSECITVGFWSLCQAQASIFTHFITLTDHKYTK